jgi:hypothetical protein
MSWATFWAIFAPTRLVALFAGLALKEVLAQFFSLSPKS